MASARIDPMAATNGFPGSVSPTGDFVRAQVGGLVGGLMGAMTSPAAPVGRLSATLDALAVTHGEIRAALATTDSLVERVAGQVRALGGDLPPSPEVGQTAAALSRAPETVADRLGAEQAQARSLLDRLTETNARLATVLDALDAVR